MTKRLLFLSTATGVLLSLPTAPLLHAAPTPATAPTAPPPPPALSPTAPPPTLPPPIPTTPPPPEATDDEKKALHLAEQSFKEGAFDLCSSRVAAFLKKYPKSPIFAEASLLQARALYLLGRDDAALAALNIPASAQTSDALEADIVFWQAEILLDSAKWPDAEKKYRTALLLKNLNGHLDAVNLGLAWALFKQGRENDAQPLIQALIKDKPDSPAGRHAQLMLAKIDLVKNQLKEAIAGLEALLATKPETGIAFETNYWLGEACSANSQPDKAVAAYRKVADDPKAFPRPLLAQAWLGLGGAEHALHQDDQAMLAYEQTYKLTENETTRLDAFRSYLESARIGKQLPEAIVKLQEFAKTTDKSAPAALFAIGSVLAENGDDDKAIGILESLLVAYPSSPPAPSTNYQLGQLYARTGKPDQAVKALLSCIAANSDPVLVRSARFQLGYVYLNQTKDFASAAAQFALISDGTDTAAEDAAYNYLLAEAYLAKIDVFLKAEADFEKRFPKSTHAKSLALTEGQLLARQGKTDIALATYQKAIDQGGTGPDQLALLQALADLQYQTGDLKSAESTYNTIATQFPDHTLAAAESGILISHERKEVTDEDVERLLIALLQKYGSDPGAPKAYFRLGEFYFDNQDFVKAQDAFQQLITAYPNSSYTDQAYFRAGQSAFGHQDYTSAISLLEKVPDNSPIKPDARLWEGRVYQEQLNFDQAIAQFDAVLLTDKTGTRFVQANLLKGLCYFALGSKNTDNYTKAMAAFDLIRNGKDGTVAERNEAAVKSAKCLEQLGHNDQAMALYLDVLYGHVAGDDATSPSPPEFSWQFEAGWAAGQMREAQKDWRGAIEIYKRLEQIGGAHAQQAHDLIDKLRRDNYIYE